MRKEKLGREHAYTLLAMVNLARVKSSLGDTEGAEALFIEGLPIAERNLGVEHFAYLWARYELGKVWIRQKRWTEAEILLKDITEKQKTLLQGRGRFHPDRIGGLIELANVLHVLGKHEECEGVVDEALRSLSRISKTEHPFATKLKADRDEWRRERDASVPTASTA